MWTNKNDISDLTGVAASGQLPTLSVGIYNGMFISAYRDADKKQWITLTTSNGSHIEQNDMDVSHLKPQDKVQFTITSQDGAGLAIRGTRYRLLDSDRKTGLTPWTDLATVYKYIKDNDVVLAGPRITEITTVE